jgi:parallel beta-helix repeat protein
MSPVLREEVFMKRTATVFIVLSLVWLVNSAEGRLWHIKADGSGDAPTIQGGIDSAATGDAVVLAPGTYTGVGNRGIDFKGKAITVTSDGGRDVTIIECQGLAKGFRFHSGEGSSSVLSGVTIHNGSGPWGSGIDCEYSSPTISDNTISGNSALEDGGGIYCEYASPTIANNTIKDNSAGYYGGGISCKPGSPTISDNTISGNSADGGGGIFYTESCSPTISNNTISGNSANGGGGIFSVLSATATIRNTIIAFNTAGGGIFCFLGSNPTLTNCDIYGNVGGNALCGTDGGGNISSDPLFCDSLGNDSLYIRSDSPCAPGNHPSGELIGAWPVGCDAPTSVEAPADGVPTAYNAYQSYPNPFNPHCTIRYDIPKAGGIRLQVFDVSGSLVRTLVDGWREPGAYSEIWDGRGDRGAQLPSGVYFYSIEAGDFVATRKMVLLK